MDNSKFLQKIMEAIPLGERTTSGDFSISSNAQTLEELQRVAFLDSRGKKIFPESDPNYTAELLAKEWSRKGEKYLILTRTHASTTFFTLLNFLDNLQVRVPYLLTNMGFVDFTPKKRTVVEDILLQAQPLFSGSSLKIANLDSYKLTSGEIETLVVVDMTPLLDDLTKYLTKFCEKVVFIGTHELSEKVKFERKRPGSFYSQLKETNKFIQLLGRKMKFSEVLMPPGESIDTVQDLVFDGVHFTKLGHEELFKKLVLAGLI